MAFSSSSSVLQPQSSGTSLEISTITDSSFGMALVAATLGSDPESTVNASDTSESDRAGGVAVKGRQVRSQSSSREGGCRRLRASIALVTIDVQVSKMAGIPAKGKSRNRVMLTLPGVGSRSGRKGSRDAAVHPYAASSMPDVVTRRFLLNSSGHLHPKPDRSRDGTPAIDARPRVEGSYGPALPRPLADVVKGDRLQRPPQPHGLQRLSSRNAADDQVPNTVPGRDYVSTQTSGRRRRQPVLGPWLFYRNPWSSTSVALMAPT